MANDEWFAGQYENYGYGAGSERESTSLTYSCEPIEGLVVIGIDSGTDGVVSSTTLDWVAEKATEARNSGKNVIALMHHPLIPHFTGFENLVETAVVVNYETVRNTLADAGISVIFSGHFHTSDIAMDKNADLTKEIYDVNTGSLASYPCDYRVVTLSEDLAKMSIITEHISELVSGDGFAEMAKNRLQTVIQETVASREENYSLITPIAAHCYMIHAEGNEPDNPNSAPLLLQTEILAGVIALMMGEDMAQSFKDMANSMLQDKSQYGVEDRENVTNDLTLELDLPEVIIVGINGHLTGSPKNGLNTAYYNLAGQRVKTPGKGLYLVNGKKIVVR